MLGKRVDMARFVLSEMAVQMVERPENGLLKRQIIDEPVFELMNKFMERRLLIKLVSFLIKQREHFLLQVGILRCQVVEHH